ncbi:acyl-CoA synthetase [Allopusillimonas ginsengisoli]|uniref:acyl-CoA synthetase n=1 Tax=Allopusillimonas ginsengisoli TaxID=453575 RepID=UPI0039C1DC07
MNDQYPDLYQSFQWLVPSQFNIAQACVHRWAENTLEGRRIAIFHENEAGTRDVWTYTRLSDTTQKLANALMRMGVQRGDRVAVVLDQRPETVASYMAIFSVGAIALPLCSRFGVDGLAIRLKSAGAHVAIVDAGTAPDVVSAQGRCPALTQIIGIDCEGESVIPWRTLLARQSTGFKPIPTSSDSPALLLYTSGTTREPKGVLLAHRALIGSLPGFVASQNWFPQKSDIFWTPTDWTWGSGIMDALLPTLYFGQAIVGAQGRYTPVKAMEIMGRYQVSNVLLPPTLLHLMMTETPSPGDTWPLHLRAVACAGEPVKPEAFKWCEQALGITPNEMFGQTELNYVIGNSHKRWPALPGSLGRPYPGHQAVVLDKHGKVCPSGVVGEIAINRYDIHGHPDPALFLGYWQDETTTKEKFDGHWFLTGDLASVDEQGYYWYAGRRDDVFKSSGYRIGPGEIEECLMRHAAVASAAVVPKPDSIRGALIKAYVILKPSMRPTDGTDLQAELQEYVRSQLASHQTPREIEFVDKLPLTSTGKIRRSVLRAREEQRHGGSPSSGH